MTTSDYLSFEADFSSPRIIDAYDEAPLWSAMFGLLLLDEVPLAGVRTALDVGCGAGFPLIELAERLGPSAHVHGIDPWKAGLARASHKASCRATANVTVHEGTASHMPFADGTFDLIVSNLGVNNFENREDAMRECRRVVRNGAIIALTTNLQGHMRELYEIFECVLIDHGTAEQIDALHAHVGHRATVATVRDLLESAGFEVTRVVERTGRMRFASGTALLNHHFIKLGFLDGWKNVVAGHERETFPILQKRLDDFAREHDGLALTIPMAYVEGRAR
jgi:ubiquinone/menaquinone biosynthesis C-methylase UbiE